MTRRQRQFRERASHHLAHLLPRAERALAALLARHGVAGATPRIRVELRIRDIGRAAGQVRGDVVTINSQLVDFPDDVRDTMAHELAHVVVDRARRRLRIRRRDGEWATHGAAWKAAAKMLGDSGDRCHALPLEPRRTVARYLYRLPDGTERILSAIRHNRLQRNRDVWYHFRGDAEPVRGTHFVAELDPRAAMETAT
ncbi:MAG: hypothetical protein P8Y54_14760 [Xanthomonadales bacterium]